MISKLRFVGRPLHPMIVAFPMAFFVATVAALLAYLSTSDIFYYRAGMIANVSGVALALAAMLPSALELRSLPRRAREAGHRLVFRAGLVTGTFALSAALLYRGWTARGLGEPLGPDATVPLAVGVLGLVMLVSVALLEVQPRDGQAGPVRQL